MIIRFGGAVGIGGTSEMANVTQAFQPSGRFSAVAQLLATFVAGHHPRRVGAGTFYFVNLGLEVVGGVGAAGERLNVSQRFQPAGRFALANSP
ncbi:hypothetical protein GCM10007857_47390 [Bradyrhizobium iriomotense]|uniref:Uncharacterized protein n=1 Tax=Bradyrhizobium iriomotense TaxID=441950 RepID=A0ABQ6B0S5_9BRAD|nr:hypothetical protein GCM10007857_47390 [Bradyrhizobium iriomotense]